MRSCDTKLSVILSFVSRRLSSYSSSSMQLDSSSCDLNSQQILKEYAIREINLLLWFALIGSTALLVNKLLFVLRFWAYGYRISGPCNPQLKPNDAAEVPLNSGVGSYILNDAFKNAAFLPFGSGLCACVGQKFAVLGPASIVASLLERYEIKLVPESDIGPRPSMMNCAL